MRRLAFLLLLCGCATAVPESEERPIALLDERPQREYAVVAPVEARGVPGEPVGLLYEALQDQARALDADAVIVTTERAFTDAAPAPYDPPQRPLLGNAYPGPLHDFEPGAFPPEGYDVRTRGTYYVLGGLAIRYAAPASVH